MTDFVLNSTVLRVIRNLAGRVDPPIIAIAVGCPVHKLETLCREHMISLKRDDEPAGVR